MRSRSSATATVDLPEPDRPVSQTVAPGVGRSSGRTSPSCQVTLVLTPDRSGARRRAEDHPRAHGVVGALVDEDERAGGAVAAVLVEEERRGGAQLHPADLVERERIG